MTISTLEVNGLRNLKEIHISPVEGFNFFIGPNGSGKSSLLEAIHCLGRGKSFRTHKTNRLIAAGSTEFTVLGRIQQGARHFTIGMQRKRSESNIRLAGKTVSRSSELTQALPVAVIDPGLHQLIEEGPEYRRKFLDWGVFHVEHDFHHIWNSYRRILLQRNAALRSTVPKSAVITWDTELAQAATQLDQARRHYLRDLQDFIPKYSEQFEDLAELSVNYQQGWRDGETFSDYLAAQYQSDKDRGFTQFGPHRADMRIKVGGTDAREHLSRGQQKVLVASLILAQCEQIRFKNTSVVILVDDFPSELDEVKRIALLDCLKTTKAQVFLTGTDSALFPMKDEPHGMFHVEQGRIQSVG